jgi:UTP--glucose-1-phosphate uridylyltransferase
MAKELVNDEYFAVLLPDDVMDCETPCLKQMLEVQEKVNGGVLAVQKTDADGQKRYGIVKVEPTDDPRISKIVDIVEKPGVENAPSDLAVMGRYVLPREIFEELEQTQKGAGGEIQLTDAIKAMLQKKDFYAYEYEGERLDAGEVAGYVKATIKLALRRPEIAEEIKEYLKKIEA